MGPVLLSNETQFNGIIWPDRCNGNPDFSNESGGSLHSTGRLVWIQEAVLGLQWGLVRRVFIWQLEEKQTWVMILKSWQTFLWNIPAHLTMLPVWDRNNWHGSLWRSAYVSRRGEVRRSYQNKSLKQRHKEQVKKLENKTWAEWKEKEWERGKDGAL